MVSSIVERCLSANYSKFMPGDVFCGTITSISDLQFFVAEDGFSLPAMKRNELEKIWWYVGFNEPFMLETDDGMYRAVRVPLTSLDFDKTIYMEVCLLDTGETFVLPIQHFQYDATYEMPDSHKLTPALTYKCELHEVFCDDFVNGAQIRQSNKFRKFTIEVMAVEDECLLVDVYPYDNSPAELPKCPSEEEIESEACELQVELGAMELDAKDEVQQMAVEDFSPNEQLIWNAEPFSTDNPQVAVQGFETKDEDRICRFYDPELGGCWKGGQCTLRHVRPIGDGTCRDQETIFYCNIGITLQLPAVNSRVKIKITTVTNTNNFWCLRENKNEAMQVLLNKMNEPREIESYKLLKALPAELQLVSVKARDGKFYRGRVCSISDNELTTEIFLVDLGVFEEVYTSSVFNWMPHLANDLPFQAVEMEIANIKPLNVHDQQEAINAIHSLIDEYDNKFRATIVENCAGIKCKLMTCDYKDVGEILVAYGLALPKSVAPQLASLQFIPV